MQTRENALHQWLNTIYPSQDYTLKPLAGDASFRRYYRLHHAGTSRVIMDSPPDKVKLAPFVYIRTLLAEHDIITPQIYVLDEVLGFAILEDFGDILLCQAFNQLPTQPLYESAIDILTHMQHSVSQGPVQLDTFDQPFMLQELSLFHDWFLHQYLGLDLATDERQLLDTTFQMLTTQIASQPKVLVHRDYHSRNIMLLEESAPAAPKFGIIDFQDAMLGPIAYDLVSLLKDCYIHLPREELMRWLQHFYDRSPEAQHYTFPEFQRAFDWCGLQRHLRVLGTFARLHLRDGKSNYLNDLPRTYQYVMTCLADYPEFQVFSEWLEHRVHPSFQGTLV